MSVEAPLHSSGRSSNPGARALLLTAIVTVVVWWELQLLNGWLVSPLAHEGVVSVAMARDAGAARAIIDGWGRARMPLAWAFVLSDFVFIFLYVALAALSALRTGASAGWSRGARPVVLMAAAAGVLDILENVWLMFLFARLDVWFAVLHFAARARSVLIMIVAIFVLAAIIRTSWIRRAGTTAEEPCDPCRPLPPPFKNGFLPWSWGHIRCALLVLSPIRFNVLLLAMLWYVFLVNDQGRDALRVLVERPLGWRSSAFVFLAIVASTLLWYSARVMLSFDFRYTPPPERFRFLRRWVPRVIGAAAFFLLAVSVRAQGSSLPSDYILSRTIFGAGLLFVLLTLLRRWWLEARQTRVTVYEKLKDLPPIAWAVFGGGLLIAFALLIRSLFGAGSWSVHAGTPTIVLLFGIVLLIEGSAIIYYTNQHGVPILTLIVLWALVWSAVNDNHTVRTMPRSSIAPRLTVAEDFPQWRKQLPPGPQPVFIVATEGGGVRAAYWTALVLAKLQMAYPAFAQHTYGISSVSGGSLGAAVFSGMLLHPPPPGSTFVSTADAVVKQDYLAPAVIALLQPDLLQRVNPLPHPWGFPDRAKALEQAWERAWKSQTGTSTFSEGFLATFSGVRQPRMLINGTLVKTGQRIITSTLSIRHNEFPDSVDTFDYLDELPVSTAVDMSTRFTYVTPAGTLRDREGREVDRVVDGGYFENSGAATALDLVNHMPGRDWYPVLIVIRAAKLPMNQHVRPLGAEYVDKSPPKNFAYETLSPVRAMLATRDAHARVVLKQLADRVTEIARERGATLPVVADFCVEEHPDVPLPLGWALSERARRTMAAQLDGHVFSDLGATQPSRSIIASLAIIGEHLNAQQRRVPVLLPGELGAEKALRVEQAMYERAAE